MQRGLIDLAFVTPGLFTPPALPAELNRTVDRSPTDVAVDETNSDLLNEHVRYLANVGLPPAVSPWTRPERKTPGYHDRFRSVALVKRDSSLQTIEDLVDAAMHGRLRVLCVSPLSVSGSIAPRFALAKKGIRLDPTQIEYTHSHSASGRLLAETRTDEDDVETVAFVWDDSLRAAPEIASRLRAIEFPELNELVIPQEMVVAQRDFPRTDELRELLLAHQDADGGRDFLQPADWRTLASRRGSLEAHRRPNDGRRRSPRPTGDLRRNRTHAIALRPLAGPLAAAGPGSFGRRREVLVSSGCGRRHRGKTRRAARRESRRTRSTSTSSSALPAAQSTPCPSPSASRGRTRAAISSPTSGKTSTSATSSVPHGLCAQHWPLVRTIAGRNCAVACTPARAPRISSRMVVWSNLRATRPRANVDRVPRPASLAVSWP